MAHYSLLGVTLVLVMGVGGCDRTSALRAELARTNAELQKARAEIVTLKAELVSVDASQVSQSYLQELEKLAELQKKDVITSEEFDARKQAILASQRNIARVRAKSGMEELANQLTSLHQLYNASTINVQERDAKKVQLLQQDLVPTDLPKDLERAKGLYNQSIITSAEFDILKKKLLGINKESHDHD